MLFLVLFGSIYKNTSVGKISVIEVGPVPLLTQAQAHGASKVLTVTKTASLATAIADVRKGNQDAAVVQHGNTLVVRYSIADPTKASIVNSVLSSIVQDANQADVGQPPRFTIAASQVEDKSLKAIQYFAPGLLGWAMASGATFGAAITLVSWRQNKLLRRLRLAPVSTASVVPPGSGSAVAVGASPDGRVPRDRHAAVLRPRSSPPPGGWRSRWSSAARWRSCPSDCWSARSRRRSRRRRPSPT